MRNLIIILLIVFTTISLFSQENTNQPERDNNSSIIIEFETGNETKDINDAYAHAKVHGGQPPYIYHWSKQDIPLTTDFAKQLTEGSKYYLTVTDNSGKKAFGEISVPTNSTNEKINSVFVPIVKVMNKVLMADIFAALHIYDPTIRDENNVIIRHPNGDPVKMQIPFIVVWLIFGGLFFTIYMGFINIRGFKLAIQHVAGKFDKPGDKGEVSHFQALTTALSATVGLGNIAGVAIAIVIGGPGATFWMIIAGLLGMSTKFVECTLGVKYREINKKGVVSGGPMYYINKAFKNRGMKRIGKVLAVIFSILIIGTSLGVGNMFQANQAFAQLSNTFPVLNDYGILFGVLLSILIAVVTFGGIKSIAKVTDKIVPFMALFYVLVALIIIIMNIQHAGSAFGLIWHGAFSASALKGGIIGVMIVGFQRAAFSNEAGVGSAPVAHSAVKTEEPVTEGIVALLEPFIDTVVICTMTALVIIFTGFHTNPASLDGVELTSAAFGSVFSWFPYLLVIAIFIFAFSTMISWSYYGLNGFKFLFGKLINNDTITKIIYYSIFIIFIIIGSTSSLGAIVDFSDTMILSMAVPNLIALYLLSKETKNDLKKYLKKIKKIKR